MVHDLLEFMITGSDDSFDSASNFLLLRVERKGVSNVQLVLTKTHQITPAAQGGVAGSVRLLLTKNLVLMFLLLPRLPGYLVL